MSTLSIFSNTQYAGCRLALGLFWMCHVWWIGSFSSAWGYVRMQTEKGIPVYWLGGEIPYWVGRLGAPGIEDGSDIQAIHRAAEVWQQPSCAATRLVFQTLVSNPHAKFVPNKREQNVIYWVMRAEEWLLSRDALAVTLVQSMEDTGEIFDADMMLNGFSFVWGTQPQEEQHDIQNVVTHEFGHFLGLDHTLDAEATMFASAPAAETKKRSLNSNDIEGFCAIYHRDRRVRLQLQTLSSSGMDSSELQFPDAPVCAREVENEKVSERSGCSQHSDSLLEGWLLYLGLWILLHRRRKQKNLYQQRLLKRSRVESRRKKYV